MITGPPVASSAAPAPANELRVLTFQDFSVGQRVSVKSAASLEAIFASPASQWSTSLGPSLQNATAPRLQKAGMSGVVLVCDSSDHSVEIECPTGSGAKAWFSPGLGLLLFTYSFHRFLFSV